VAAAPAREEQMQRLLKGQGEDSKKEKGERKERVEGGRDRKGWV